MKQASRRRRRRRSPQPTSSATSLDQVAHTLRGPIVPEAMLSAPSSYAVNGGPDARLRPVATSVIELDRVEGVHGPRTLHVVVVTDL